MIRHLLKLAWNRKRSNALVVVEVFASFLVVFVVATSGVYVATNASLPLGFEARGAWSVRCNSGAQVDRRNAVEHFATMDRLLREARAVPGVLQASAAFSVPYDNSQARTTIPKDGRHLPVEFLDVDDPFAEVFRISVSHGRWFGPEDDGRSWQPVVLNRRLAKLVFGDEDPIGRPLPQEEGEGEARVVGIVEEFRKAGELSSDDPFLFRRVRPDQETAIPPREIAVRVAPESGTDVEQALLARLRAADPTQTYELRRIEDMRDAYFQLRLAPIVVGALVAGFLLVMVALGLLGVLWQNVTRRSRELALRRAAGASGSDIRRQILLEVLVTTTPGILLGALLVVQVPMLDLVDFLHPSSVALGLGVATVAIYALTVLCALYPAAMAMRVLPAEALRCE